MKAEAPPAEDFLPRLFVDKTLRSAVLTGLRHTAAGGGEEVFRRVDIKPITLKNKPQYQFEYRYPKKVTHRNLDPTAATDHARALLAETFTQGVFHDAEGEYHVTVGRTGEWSVRRRSSGPPAAASNTAGEEHNRRKNYLLPEGEPAPFLIRLGVKTADGRVIAARYDKFRQINRFLEMVADTLDALPTGRTLRVVDFGSGKSYLTFALYHFLHIQRGLDVQIVGLDLKRDVIAQCAAIAHDLGWEDGLRFEVGDIAGYHAATGTETVDMVVTLHACDTATDDALAQAVRWGASVILSVPCCQHELFRRIKSEAMRPLLKHGILKERMAALVTDSLRAAMLERCGYSVQVLEFIDMEHTPKNLLIRAVRRRDETSAHRQRLDREYETFRDTWGLEQSYLETVLVPPSERTGA